ncbi:hypothetical protein E3N88_06804 [Mikania micrantha]|uniref:Semialdehyde dehydrogenase NAD-binding domain-containing protein n=1 Tax=Mikania micrantha TaxID=192012 RepID=A0A5N6PPS9_9ASTR|nr:hypothetical protein E3N88_06804 [Mikania micrantha]
MNSMVSQRSAFMDERRTFFNFKNKPKLSIALKRPVRVSVVSSQKTDKSIKVGILGATGYAGLELIRCIASHPYFHVSLITAGKEAKEAGQSIGAIFPHLITRDLPDLVAINDADFSRVDAVFCCLPHGTSQEVIKSLPNRLKIVDLSVDFRLLDVIDYAKWYGQPHKALELQKHAVYGLTEIHRKKIQSASLVANPGCYPTAILLPLVPLIKANLIALEDITIYLNSGVGETGYLGTYLNPLSLYVLPEVEQELSDAANSKVTVTFISPTSPPKALRRCMLLSITVQMNTEASVEDLKQHLEGFYEKEEFVVLRHEGDEATHTKKVLGSNDCHINVFPDDCVPGRVTIISVIDKLVKGASGQALQNLNLMMGIPENLGLNCMP